MSSVAKQLGLAGLAMLVMVPVAQAQRWRASLTPFAGAFIPTKNLSQVTITAGGVDVSAAGKMKAGATFGAKINLSSRGRLGIEAGYFYASSKVGLTILNGVLGTERDGSVQGGLLRATFRATDGQTDTDVYFAAGLSGQKLSSDAFRLGQEKFNIGGSVGAGLRLAVSPQVAIRFDGDANLYSWRFRTGLPSTSQLDLLLTAGLELRLSR